MYKVDRAEKACVQSRAVRSLTPKNGQTRVIPGAPGTCPELQTSGDVACKFGQVPADDGLGASLLEALTVSQG